MPENNHSTEQVPDFDRNVYCLLGLPFDAVTLPEAVSIVRRAALGSRRCYLSTPNTNFLIACRSDDAFRNSVLYSDLSVADGMPLIWMARLLSIPLVQRVSGSGMFDHMMDESTPQVKVFFFGGPEGAAELACEVLNSTSCGVRSVGYEYPGFVSVEQMSTDAIVGKINSSGADMLVLSLPARKGSAWIRLNLPKLVVPVVTNLGAVVNFVAGTVKRAPVWMQRTGLEWFWRVIQEPQLWKRYYLDGKALFRLLVTRVFAYAWYLRRNRPSRITLDRARVTSVTQPDLVTLVLAGVWTQENLDPLRSAFKQAVEAKENLRIDLSDVDYVDSAFIGQLMILFGYQTKIRKRFELVSANTSLIRIFRWNCADFLLT